MNNSKRQQKQTDRALAKKEVTGEILVPMTKQPEYPVPDDVIALRDQQTADWDLSSDIQILRFYIAQETKNGGNAAVVAQLAKAVESLIRTNVSTALRTGEWCARASIRDLAHKMIAEADAVLKARLSKSEFEEAIDELRARVMFHSTREAVAEANNRNENL